MFSRISSLGTQLLPSPSLIPDLTQIPASATSVLFNQIAQSSLSSQLANHNPPAWFTALSPVAQSYILGIPAKKSSIIPQVVAIEQSAGLTKIVLPPPSAPSVSEAITTELAIGASITSETSEKHAPVNKVASSSSEHFPTSVLSLSSTTQSSNSGVVTSLADSPSISVAAIPTSTAQLVTQASSKAVASHATGAVVLSSFGAAIFLRLALVL